LLPIVYFKLAEPASYITNETVGFNLLGSYVDNKARLIWEVGYLTVLYVRLGAKIGDRHAKDSVCINLIIQVSHIQGHEIRIVSYALLDGGDCRFY
jgi:hypothetical protein